MARYTHPNLSELGKDVTAKIYSAVAHGAEVIVFLFLGFSIFSFDLPFSSIEPVFPILGLLGMVIGRLISVLLCSLITNTTRKTKLSLGL